MDKLAILVSLLHLMLQSCTCKELPKTYFDYGTKSDSARFYFFKGWEEILDNGRWTHSEIAFRKAIEIDPDWLLGQSMVGRISQNLEERQRILSFIKAEKDKSDMTERLLLDVQISSLQAANKRDIGVVITNVEKKERRMLAEQNLRRFIRIHPEDTYFKAEYIEILHANHGAQTALDTLSAITTISQKEKGFFISYKALLESELGKIDDARIGYQLLKSKMTDATYNTPNMLLARILIAQDSLSHAIQIVEKILEADKNHLVARGLHKQLQSKLE